MTPVQKEYRAGSIHRSDDWEGQLARVSQWLDCLMKVESPADAEDFLYAFFQNSHHLQDWLLAGRSTTGIDEFLNSSLATCICRDVANMMKYRELNR